MFKIINKTLLRLSALFSIAVLFVIFLFLLFIFTEKLFFLNVIQGNFPLPLFIKILPTLFSNFLFDKPEISVHYLVVVTLLAIYVHLLIYVFKNMRYVSVSSMSVGLAGLLGVSLGVSCLSCGAIAGILLVSVLGASSASTLFLLNSPFFLFLGEGLLFLSIILVLYTIKKYRIA